MDVASLSRWFDSLANVLALYARQWLSIEAAEDVVQEVFVRLHDEKLSPDHVKAWLFRAVRNSAISRLRSERRRHVHEQSGASRSAIWFESRPEDRLDADTARAALLTLPLEQREVIVLRIWGELTLDEIGRVTGQPTSTLFSRYRAGLAALRKALEKPCPTKVKT